MKTKAMVLVIAKMNMRCILFFEYENLIVKCLYLAK